MLGDNIITNEPALKSLYIKLCLLKQKTKRHIKKLHGFKKVENCNQLANTINSSHGIFNSRHFQAEIFSVYQKEKNPNTSRFFLSVITLLFVGEKNEFKGARGEITGIFVKLFHELDVKLPSHKMCKRQIYHII